MTAATDSRSLALGYVDALNRGDVAATLAFYADDVVQIEFPNRLLPEGARRDLAGLRAAAERGQALMRAQRFDVTRLVADGAHVAIEARWFGEVGIDAGPFRAGLRLTAAFAIFLTFRDGKIVEQRNYDCFDAW